MDFYLQGKSCFARLARDHLVFARSIIKAYLQHVVSNLNLYRAITKTRNGESGKGIGERGMGMRNGKTRNAKSRNL